MIKKMAIKKIRNSKIKKEAENRNLTIARMRLIMKTKEI